MPDPVRSQVVSIRRMEMIGLRNRQRELLKQIEVQATENITLKLGRAKLDTGLVKYTGENSEFAAVSENSRKELQQLNSELHSNSRKCQKFDHKIRAAEHDLHEAKILLRKYRELIDNERLEGMEALDERLKQKEESIREKDLEIQVTFYKLITFINYYSGALCLIKLVSL